MVVVIAQCLQMVVVIVHCLRLFCGSRQPVETKNNGSAAVPAAPTIPVPNTPLPNTPLPSTPLPVTPLPAPSSGSSTPGQGSSLPSTPTVDVKPALVMKEEGRPVDRERSDDQKVSGSLAPLSGFLCIQENPESTRFVNFYCKDLKNMENDTFSLKRP